MRRDRRESSTPVSPCELEVGGVDDEDLELIECGGEKESDEAKAPEVLRDWVREAFIKKKKCNIFYTPPYFLKSVTKNQKKNKAFKMQY